jgi:hypothetical protein
MLVAAVQTAYFFMMRMKEFGVSSGAVDPDSVLRGQDVRLTAEGELNVKGTPLEVSVSFRKTKADQLAFGIEQSLARSGDREVCPVAVMQRLRDVAPERFGQGPEAELPLFRWGNGKVLDRLQVQAILQDSAVACGLPPERFQSHSLRIGGATALYQSTGEIELVKRRGRWSSDAVHRYLHDELSAALSAAIAANMVGNGKGAAPGAARSTVAPTTDGGSVEEANPRGSPLPMGPPAPFPGRKCGTRSTVEVLAPAGEDWPWDCRPDPVKQLTMLKNDAVALRPMAEAPPSATDINTEDAAALRPMAAAPPTAAGITKVERRMDGDSNTEDAAALRPTAAVPPTAADITQVERRMDGEPAEVARCPAALLRRPGRRTAEAPLAVATMAAKEPREFFILAPPGPVSPGLVRRCALCGSPTDRACPGTSRQPCGIPFCHDCVNGVESCPGCGLTECRTQEGLCHDPEAETKDLGQGFADEPLVLPPAETRAAQKEERTEMEKSQAGEAICLNTFFEASRGRTVTARSGAIDRPPCSYVQSSGQIGEPTLCHRLSLRSARSNLADTPAFE